MCCKLYARNYVLFCLLLTVVIGQHKKLHVYFLKQKAILKHKTMYSVQFRLMSICLHIHVALAHKKMALIMRIYIGPLAH